MSKTQKEYKITGREKTIFRIKKSPDNPYVMIDRRPIDNPKLSFKAKGILTYLLSRPDGWEVNVPDLVNHGTDGPAAIRAGLKELRKCGHIRYNQEREGGYIKRWVIEVYEVPEAFAQGDDGEKVLDCDFLQVGNLQVENLQVENRGEVLSNLSNTDLEVVVGAEDKKARTPAATAAFVSQFNQNAGTLQASRVLCNASNLPAIPVNGQPYIETVSSLLAAHGEDATRAALVQARETWTKTPKKNGGGTYSVLNFGWVDWAMAALAGQDSKKDPRKEFNPFAALERYAAEAAQ